MNTTRPLNAERDPHATAGTGNLLPLLFEIRHALERLEKGGEGTTIDLQRLPLAPGEEKRIAERLGAGEVRAEFEALGRTVVQETGYPGVWLITHRNTEDRVTARLIEVTRIPDVLKSQPEDIRRGLGLLDEALEGHRTESPTDG